MPALLAGLAVLVVLILGARLLAKADTQALAAILRKAGGIALLAVAALLMARGALPIAIPLAVFGLALLGLSVGSWFGFGGSLGGGSRKTPGQTSAVRTEGLEMELDHDSGGMDGRCLKGSFAGRVLSSLSDGELLQLLAELRANDQQGALLLEAYLDRRSPDWRDRDQGGTAREERRPGGGRMSAKEAYDVLGLPPDATDDDIRAAHRKLMMKVHPDQGGSDYLAARINEAKDLLLAGK